MTDRISHRGPDDEGIYVHRSVGLGHRRLSILDLSAAGHQPMVSPDGRWVLTYNGEVYNYLELRDQLQARHDFVSDTDTEVLLAAYRVWGAACLDRLNGMFAFAIYDTERDELFAARDRFGVKPLYYARDRDRLIFGSEIPSIVAARAGSVRAEDQVVFDYLAFNRTDHSEHSFFEGVQKLQHGHSMVASRQGLRIHRWYDLASQEAAPFLGGEDYREQFASSVSLRLRSDVPVGVCLSGGLDSSSIVSTLASGLDRPDVNTFSAVFDGFARDESEHIRLFEPRLDHMHYTRPTASTFADQMLNYVRVQSEPTPSTSPFAQYEVMRLASDHVVVTLDGQGADEQLAGYPYFFGFLFKELLLAGKLREWAREMQHYERVHASIYGLKTFAFLMLPGAVRQRARVAKAGYIDADFFRSQRGENVVADHLYGATSVREALLSHFEYKLEHLLKWSDRNSMAFSLESRVPFLDYRLVERTLATDPAAIIRGGVTKRILRDAMKGWVPDPIRLRMDKVGFETPEDEWFRSSRLQSFIQDVLHSRSFRERGYVDPKRAQSLFSRHVRREISISKEVWKWINLELWFQEFVDASASTPAHRNPAPAAFPTAGMS